MSPLFTRIDVEIVGAAGQEGTERRPIVFVDNGAGVRRRQAVLPQDRQDGGAAEGDHKVLSREAAARAHRHVLIGARMVMRP